MVGYHSHDIDILYYVVGYSGTDVAEAKANLRYTTYGVLYNWPAAIAACPTGWHLPGDAEWKTLEKYLGMSTSAADSVGNRYSGSVGGKLKETGTSHWLSPNRGATNSSGFKALPGGARGLNSNYNQSFLGLTGDAVFWTSNEWESDSGHGYSRNVWYGNTFLGRWPNLDLKSNGYSFRCIKD